MVPEFDRQVQREYCRKSLKFNIRSGKMNTLSSLQDEFSFSLASLCCLSVWWTLWHEIISVDKLLGDKEQEVLIAFLSHQGCLRSGVVTHFSTAVCSLPHIFYHFTMFYLFNQNINSFTLDQIDWGGTVN